MPYLSLYTMEVYNNYNNTKCIALKMLLSILSDNLIGERNFNK